MTIVLNPDPFIVLVGPAFSVEEIQANHESRLDTSPSEIEHIQYPLCN